MLSEEDNVKVAQLAALFPEIKMEIDTIEQSLLQVGDDTTDAPSASVKENLFAHLATASYTNSVSDNSKSESAETNKEEVKVIQMNQPKRTNYMMVASVAGLIVCAAAIAYLAAFNGKYRNEVNSLHTDVSKLTETSLTYYQSLQLYQDTSYQKINLTKIPGKADALVQLFWNKATQKVYVANISLPVAPTGKQYQLWALIDGKPVNAGLLTGNKLPQKMLNFSKADAFAITLEKFGGSPTPTMSEMYVLGKTS